MCDTKYWKSIRAFDAAGEMGGFVICFMRSDGLLVQKTLYPSPIEAVGGFSKWDITAAINKLEEYRNCACTIEFRCEKHKEHT